MKSNERFIDLEGKTRVGLLESDSGDFLGVGEVSVGGVPLRDGRRPIVIRFDTPSGILYSRLVIQDIKAGASGETRVSMKALGLPWGRTEYCDEHDQTMVDLGLPLEAVEDRFVLILSPAQLSLGGREWRGLSMAFSFQSDGRVIHRIWTHATWEIGGSIAGNTVLHQGQCNEPVYHGARDTLFTTSCLKSLTQHGNPQGISYQLASRGGSLQTFDFQHSPQGALMAYWPMFDSISSVIESPRGSDHLHVVDEHRFPLKGEVTSSSKHILFTPGPLEEHEARDLWWEAHERVNGGIRAMFGIKPTIPMPEAVLYKGARGRLKNRRFRIRILDDDVDSAEIFQLIADKVLPKFSRQGIRRFWINLQVTQTDATELGMRKKLDLGLHGDLTCSGPCATHRFYPSDFWGGMKAWKYFVDKAHGLDMKVGHWFAPHLSPRAPILTQHPEYRMTNVNTLHRGGGYGDSVCALDWNTGVYDWMLQDLKCWKEEGGLDYLFVDSWSNTGLLPMNYSEGMRTNTLALGRFYADLQKIGIESLAFEGVSPYGLPWFGVSDLHGDQNPGSENRIVGQNDFGWWVKEEDMAYGLLLAVSERKRTGVELERIQFRLMASRSYAAFCSDEVYDLKMGLPGWWERLNHTYLQVVPHMKTRRLLPQRKGVCWEDGDVRIVWAFEQNALRPGSEARVEMFEGEKIISIEHQGWLHLKPWSVYRIRNVPAGTKLF